MAGRCPVCSAPGSLDTRLRYAVTRSVKVPQASRALDGLTNPSFSTREPLDCVDRLLPLTVPVSAEDKLQGQRSRELSMPGYSRADQLRCLASIQALDCSESVMPAPTANHLRGIAVAVVRDWLAAATLEFTDKRVPIHHRFP